MRNRKPTSPAASSSGSEGSRPARARVRLQPPPRDSEESPSPERRSWPGMLYKLILAASVAAVAFFGYRGFNATRVNTPFATVRLAELSRLEPSDYYWGSYRPGVYFGTRTRVPYSLLTGLMWYDPEPVLAGRQLRLRHWCDQADGLKRYGWLRHDGKNFGLQEILDGDVLLETSFVKSIHGRHGGDWTARIRAREVRPSGRRRQFSLLYYAAIENKTNGYVNPVVGERRGGRWAEATLTGVEGQTDELGYFRLNFRATSRAKLHQSYLSTAAPSLSQLPETVYHSFRGAEDRIILPGERLRANGQPLTPNLIVSQVSGELPFELEVSFERSSMKSESERLTGERYGRALEGHIQDFDAKFERVFGLRERQGYGDAEVAFAKHAFSNMIGSLGYFYGSALVQSEHSQRPVPYWRAALFTAVPSRSFFPRGFLWDEGFHGLLLLHWSLDLEMDIISHWFDLMNVEGWIPREMILGEEALAKVPQEFVVQMNTNANPPTFLLTLEHVLRHKREEFLQRHLDLLEKLYPRLQAWYDWYNTTQRGKLPGSYRWRGRNRLASQELNPKTLTSGFDDYPRASHPSDDERHVDLRCWMAVASRVMAGLADILQRPGHRYRESYEYLADNRLLNELHWSPRSSSYADWGLHTDRVRLKRLRRVSRNGQVTHESVREVLEKPERRFVDSSFGYVSLFPFALRLIEPGSEQLARILQDLRKPDLLWTRMGLRSLAKNAPLYGKHNTEHDPPYWRGPIWMNMNYLTVSALHHYASVEGPYQAEAKEIYVELRKNLIDNVFKQYNRTGYIWENYGDKEGEGKGSHPFTGWTSLVVLLMAELY